MKGHKSSTRGQALIMVTVALFAMCGLIGMAVDFGWSFYVRRTAQAAADAAALAAVNNAWDLMSGGATLSCSSSAISCDATDCTGGGSGNLKFACKYAGLNGFSAGGDSGRQTISVTAGVPSPSPGPPSPGAGVNVYYWVTVRISNTIPQLYSAILGNANSTISARATAAIVRTNVRASLIGLNRENDPGPNGMGVDLRVYGVGSSGAKLRAANGIFLSSTNSSATGASSGAGDCNRCAGVTGYPDDSVPVYTLIRADGATKGGVTGGGTSWAWSNQPDGAPFFDPMRNLGQPPIESSASSLPKIGVLNGNLSSSVSGCDSGSSSCPPAIYYATDTTGKATGGPITVSSTLNFRGGSFGDYIFFGGLNLNSATVDFGPGQYVMAGVATPTGSSPPNYDFSISQSIVTGGTGSDAGRMFLLTDSHYPGLASVESGLDPILSTLQYGPSGIAPNGDFTTKVTLNGLDPTSSALPPDTNSRGSALQDFGPLLFWQDQGFSNVVYTPSGNIDTSCAGCTLDNPKTQSTPIDSWKYATGDPGAPFKIWTIGFYPDGSPYTNLNGVIYQPRGSWMQIGGAAHLSTMQMISGAFKMGSDANQAIVMLPPLPHNLMRRAVALVE